MPSFPIIDSHLHLWDPRRLTYPWLFDPLDRPFLPADFQAASAGIDIDALVFLECDAAIGQAFAEAEAVLDWAREEPRIAAMVCNAPLETGDAARHALERLARRPQRSGASGASIRTSRTRPSVCAPISLRGCGRWPITGFRSTSA